MAESNGYLQLVAMGRSLVGTEILATDASPAETDVADFLRANSEPLVKARSALRGDCRVPLVEVATFFEEHCGDISPLRDLARSFAMEMTVAAQRNEMSRVVDIGLELFDLANASRRGGLVLDSQVSVAFEDLAIRKLNPLRHRLSASQRCNLADGLLQTEAGREPFEAIVIRDVNWERAVGWADQPVPEIKMDGRDTNPNDPVDQFGQAIGRELQVYLELPLEHRRLFVKQFDDQQLALMRLLAIDLALNACRAILGAFPSCLAKLNPDFIVRLPTDPFTGGEFKYREAGETYCLYSTGPSGQDCGGKFGNWLEVVAGKADLGLDFADHEMICSLAAPQGGWGSKLIDRLRGLLRWRRN